MRVRDFFTSVYGRTIYKSTRYLVAEPRGGEKHETHAAGRNGADQRFPYGAVQIELPREAGFSPKRAESSGNREREAERSQQARKIGLR